MLAFFIISNPLWESLFLTLKLAFITTLLLALIGLPLAHWLNTSRFKLISVIETVFTLPLVLPPTVLGFYLLIVLSPTHPPGSWWLTLTGTTLVFSFPGLIIASIIYSLPFALQPFQAALKTVPEDLLNAGSSLGATPWKVWYKLHLPIAWRGITAGLTLAFAHTLGEFGVVLMIGGAIPGVTKVASIALFDEVQTLDYSEAHRFAAILLVISFILLLTTTLLQRHSRRK
jgi:molybdate transport system permease protein